MKTSLVIPLAIAIGGIIIAGALYAAMPKKPQTDTGTNASLIRPVSANDHILGNPAARVMIVEYSDFDCEFCKSFHSTLHQIVANEGARGDVAWVFRHFPLYELHANALVHARASECVAQVAGNAAFWKFADALYENQPANPLKYGELAFASSGVSTVAFATCFSSAAEAINERIIADRKNALDMGAVGTPFSVILVDGKAPVVIDAAYPYDAVRELVEQALE